MINNLKNLDNYFFFRNRRRDNTLRYSEACFSNIQENTILSEGKQDFKRSKKIQSLGFWKDKFAKCRTCPVQSQNVQSSYNSKREEALVEWILLHGDKIAIHFHRMKT